MILKARTTTPRAGCGPALEPMRFAVATPLLVSITRFVLGVAAVVKAGDEAFRPRTFGSTSLTAEFLTVIGVMRRAVVFHLIGVVLYSLFIEPLNLTAALGMESLAALQSKVLRVAVVSEVFHEGREQHQIRTGSGSTPEPT